MSTYKEVEQRACQGTYKTSLNQFKRSSQASIFVVILTNFQTQQAIKLLRLILSLLSSTKYIKQVSASPYSHSSLRQILR